MLCPCEPLAAEELVPLPSLMHRRLWHLPRQTYQHGMTLDGSLRRDIHKQEGLSLVIQSLGQWETFCLIYFPATDSKFPDKSNLRQKGLVLAHSSRVQSMIEGKSKWEKLEAAGQIASIVRKTSNVCCFPTPFLHLSSQGYLGSQGMMPLRVGRYSYLS